MKRLKGLFTAMFLLSFVEMATAQDVIVKKDQSTVTSKVLEITSTEIKYKKWSNQDGPTYSISRSEVASINYENGEVEHFSETTNQQQNNDLPQVQYFNSYMTKSGGRLNLNGRPLSDSEIRRLVGAEGYEQYQKGRKLGQTGIILDVVGGTALLVGLGMKLFGTNNTSGPSAIGTSSFKSYLAINTTGAVLLGTGIILGISGGERIEKVAKAYNKKHGNAYSFNISPTIMKCETLQSQSDCGMGLTLTMNF